MLMLNKKVLVKLEDVECCAILEASKFDEVVDDHEGTNGEGNVGV